MILVLYTTHGRGDEEHEIHTAALGGHFYRPQTKLRKGNVFTPVCQSFCSHGGGGLPQCMLEYTPLGRHPPADTPRQTHPLGRHAPLPSACWDTRPLPSACCDSHDYCCRWYASYWNAFLFYDLFYSTKWTPPGRHTPLGQTCPRVQCMLGYTHTPCPVHAGIVMATAADGTHPTGMHSCFMTYSTVPSGHGPIALSPSPQPQR